LKKGIAQNNSMAGQTIAMPQQQASSYSTVSGYRFVVKGKTLGTFSMPPFVEVNDNSTFAVGVDQDGKPVALVNGKKIMLDKNKVQAMTGQIIRSNDLRKFVYIELKPLSDAEMDAALANPANTKYVYNVVKSDGTVSQVTDYTSTGKWALTNSGSVISINSQTGEVYADGKKAGKFRMKEGSYLDPASVFIGSSVSKIAFYDGAEGSINYLDGTVAKLGIFYPTVVSENGKNYLTWFRKCRNTIYKAKYAF
jgi:hypothetical protein